jgi:hypothetical protein
VSGEAAGHQRLLRAVYCEGEVMTATLGWFFAAARTMEGPPMSICSTHSSKSAAGGDGLGERVQVAHHQIERLDAELGELFDVGRLAPVGQDARVHARVQGLDPAVEALGEPGEVGHLGDGEARRREHGVGPARRHEAHARIDQGRTKIDQPGLVVDRDQGALDGCAIHALTPPSCPENRALARQPPGC